MAKDTDDPRQPQPFVGEPWMADHAAEPDVGETKPKLCPFCGDDYEEDESEVCAGCRKVGCFDCVEWCAPEYDPPNGDYFCPHCQSGECEG